MRRLAQYDISNELLELNQPVNSSNSFFLLTCVASSNSLTSPLQVDPNTYFSPAVLLLFFYCSFTNLKEM